MEAHKDQVTRVGEAHWVDCAVYPFVRSCHLGWFGDAHCGRASLEGFINVRNHHEGDHVIIFTIFTPENSEGKGEPKQLGGYFNHCKKEAAGTEVWATRSCAPPQQPFSTLQGVGGSMGNKGKDPLEDIANNFHAF